jgi:uncharacterized membrane protein YfcA
MDSYLLIVIGGAVLAASCRAIGVCVLAGRAFGLDMGCRSSAGCADGGVRFAGRTGGGHAADMAGTELKRLAPFVIGGLLGVPLGIFLLGILDPAGFKLGLGMFLLVYCPAMFFAPTTWALRWGGAWANGAAGWLGGIFGGIGGFAGALPQLWCTLRGWDKDTQRGVMQVFNICMHVATLTGYMIAGNRITGETLKMFAIITPALVIPVLLGALVFRRLDQKAFRRIVLGLLFLSGIALTSSSIGVLFH